MLMSNRHGLLPMPIHGISEVPSPPSFAMIPSRERTAHAGAVEIVEVPPARHARQPLGARAEVGLGVVAMLAHIDKAQSAAFEVARNPWLNEDTHALAVQSCGIPNAIRKLASMKISPLAAWSIDGVKVI